jgi:hypothetical protein
MQTRILAVSLLLLVACKQPVAEQNAPGLDAPATGNPSRRPETPVVVRWNERSFEDGRLLLIAQIKLRTPMPTPTQVQIQVPPGTTLVRGEAAFQIPPTKEPLFVEREYAFRVTEVTDEDLLVIADARTQAFGVHATDAWTFGRPKPELRPDANGEDVRVGGRNLGPSVNVTPSR